MNEPSVVARVEKKHLFIVGAITTLLISAVQAHGFRLDVRSPAAFLGWYGLSMLVGGGAALFVGRLISLTAFRSRRVVLFGCAVLAALGAYALQLYALLLAAFRFASWG